MNNKGWVGFLVIIIIFSILSIGLFGFITYKNSYKFKFFDPEVKISDSKEATLANKTLTTLPVTLPQITPTTKPVIIVTKPEVKVSTEPQIYINSNQLKETCEKYEIVSGDLKSNKCYSQEDYDQISNLYADYNYEVSTLDFVEDRIKLTCDGSDFFKSSCEDAKKDQSNQKSRIENLKIRIKQIISRGK